jgi:tetrahydromethanopterin S-methyltransferase subunit G
MDEQEQYEKVCKPEFQELKDICSKIYAKLFEDNNGECIQSKLNRHERWIGILKWCAVSIGSILIIIITTLITRSILST